MKQRSLRLGRRRCSFGWKTLLVVLAMPGVGMAAAYTWTAGGVNDAWSTFQNWSCGGPGCVVRTVPDDTWDTATFDTTGGTVYLVTATIGAMTIKTDVDFGDWVGNAALTVSSLEIVGGASSTTTVTLDLARIYTN